MTCEWPAQIWVKKEAVCFKWVLFKHQEKSWVILMPNWPTKGDILKMAKIAIYLKT